MTGGVAGGAVRREATGGAMPGREAPPSSHTKSERRETRVVTGASPGGLAGAATRRETTGGAVTGAEAGGAARRDVTGAAMTGREAPPSSHTKSGRSAARPYTGWHGLLPAALALSHALEREMDQALAIVPLSAAGFVVLLAIDREAPPTQEALARRLSLGAGTLSEQLRRLERSGLVRRNPARRGGSHPGGAHPDGAHPARGEPAAALTARGAIALAEAEDIAVRVERAWARRLSRAAGDPDSRGRACGLRRWLTESRAAIAGGDRATGRPPPFLG